MVVQIVHGSRRGSREIMRGELAAILHEATRDSVEYLFGDSILEIPYYFLRPYELDGRYVYTASGRGVSPKSSITLSGVPPKAPPGLPAS